MAGSIAKDIFTKILLKLQSLNPSCHIVFSSILPRPIDVSVTQPFVEMVNNQVWWYCIRQKMRISVWRTYGTFWKKGAVKSELFLEKRMNGIQDLLHLNDLGVDRLTQYIQDKISTLVASQNIIRPWKSISFVIIKAKPHHQRAPYRRRFDVRHCTWTH